MNPTELFFAILVGALAMVTPALMLLRAAAIGRDACPPAPLACAPPPVVEERHLHLHYHAPAGDLAGGPSAQHGPLVRGALPVYVEAEAE